MAITLQTISELTTAPPSEPVKSWTGPGTSTGDTEGPVKSHTLYILPLQAAASGVSLWCKV